jgi:D-alanyl-lipoteichoic acid acyltransferase DltB (MBOAT superfamily)
MLFNSLEYLLFVPTVFLLYWFIFQKNTKFQNLLILFSSYFFYAWWDWRFLSLIFLSTVLDFFVGPKIYESKDKRVRKNYLWVSILFNLSVLVFFKYFNFFIDSWIDLLGLFGYEQSSVWTLNVILPVGISFYTFQTMSYTLDIYYKKLKPTNDFISFAAFVSFFPQLVAGPIERASKLLPQILTKRIFKYEQSVQGLRLILWGMFKKIVVADSLAIMVDDIFLNYQSHDGGVLVFGAILFAFQIYGDFSGYSDIAIGTAKLFGIELMSNFKFPYFSRNIEEFWQRWHISLSSWFRDYLYLPLFNKIDDNDLIDETIKFKIHGIKVTFITFAVSGFWHGANWTFIVWGLIHGLMYLPLFLFNKNRDSYSSTIGDKTFFPTIKESVQVLTNFLLVTIAWVFFRSESVTTSVNFLIRAVSNFTLSLEYIHPKGYRLFDYILLVIIFILCEYKIRHNERSPLFFNNKYLNWITYSTLLFVIYLFMYDNVDNSFIYFQF